MDVAPAETTLASLPVGSRLLIRSRKDWRFAAISRISGDRAILTVCSPSGHTYGQGFGIDAQVIKDGSLYLLLNPCADSWRNNLGHYDKRW